MSARRVAAAVTLLAIGATLGVLAITMNSVLPGVAAVLALACGASLFSEGGNGDGGGA